MTKETKLNLISAVWLPAVVGIAACLQLDAPLPAGTIRETNEAPGPPPVQVSPPAMIRGAREGEDPLGTSAPELAEGNPVNGAPGFEEAGAQAPPTEPSRKQDATDAAPLAPPENAFPPHDAGPNDDSTLGTPCPSGSIVFVGGVRYVCGRNGAAYEPALIWLLST